MKKNILIVLLIVALLILSVFLYKSCTGCKKKSAALLYPHVPVDTTQVIFWKKPGIATDAFIRHIDSLFPDAQIDKKQFCADCDSALIIVTGADVALYLSGHNSPPPGTALNGGKPSGGDGFAYYSVNFPMDFKDDIPGKPRDSLIYNRKEEYDIDSAITDIKSPRSFSGDTAVVAVFDTGADSLLLSNQLYHSNDDSCCLGIAANNGWNFPYRNADWKDDYLSKHGTVVSKLTVDQTYRPGSGNTFIKILPVKVHDSAGVSHLYDILCALQYAKNRGADIINASFGYYAPRISSATDTAAAGGLLFEAFLKQYFSGNNMLMIAAAGNKDDENEQHVFSSPDVAAMRNLDSVNFYPASFAKSIPNVIAVTTIRETTKEVSPHQNFSPGVVDIGVDADAYQGDTAYVFFHPFIPNITVEGSSFATPVVTGKIASNYAQIKQAFSGAGLPFSKEDILNKMDALHLLSSSPGFNPKIKSGRITEK